MSERIEKYWCDKCNDFVGAIKGTISHPHLGEKTAFVCSKDNYPLYLKEDKPKELV